MWFDVKKYPFPRSGTIIVHVERNWGVIAQFSVAVNCEGGMLSSLNGKHFLYENDVTYWRYLPTVDEMDMPTVEIDGKQYATSQEVFDLLLLTSKEKDFYKEQFERLQARRSRHTILGVDAFMPVSTCATILGPEFANVHIRRGNVDEFDLLRHPQYGELLSPIFKQFEHLPLKEMLRTFYHKRQTIQLLHSPKDERFKIVNFVSFEEFMTAVNDIEHKKSDLSSSKRKEIAALFKELLETATK